jgi:hypothetical protein
LIWHPGPFDRRPASTRFYGPILRHLAAGFSPGGKFLSRLSKHLFPSGAETRFVVLVAAAFQDRYLVAAMIADAGFARE